MNEANINESGLLQLCFDFAKSAIQMKYADAFNSGYVSDEMIDFAVLETVKMACLSSDMAKRVRQRLESHFNVAFDSKAVIYGMPGGKWITADYKLTWKHWPQYRSYLANGRPLSVLAEMDGLTDKILNILPDPRLGDRWHHKGLVYGDIQSGKTSTMIALAAKSADVGFKYIIFLTGGEEDLRTQTQQRVDEGLIGVTRRSKKRGEISSRQVGVGKGLEIFMNSITSFDHDLSNKNNTAIWVSSASAPVVAVVKKNVKVLQNLHTWICGQHNIDPKNPGKTINHSVLIIDDECDFASIDTNKKDQMKPTEDHQPTKINAGIRAIRNVFDRSVYCGFSATPFANLLTDKAMRTEKNGDDLYPSSFVVAMVNPVNYLGVERLIGFGSRKTGDDAANDQGLPELYSFISEADLEWLPHTHKKGHQVVGPLPASLKQAIQRFILVSAVREQEHNSMLVNLTRFQDVQGRLRTVIESYASEVGNALAMDDKPTWASLKKMYNQVIVPSFRSILERDEYERGVANELPDWEAMPSRILDVCQRLVVKAIHGASDDVLQYVDNQRVCVIAVGGQKLSRGITLEGLSISYFGRNTPQSDSGLQMGRWFGYRDGYLGLCHLYLSKDTFQNFQRMAETSYNLRDEIGWHGGNPDPEQMDIGFKVHKGHRITAINKMRNAVTVQDSFDGRMPETKIFDPSKAKRESNREAVAAFFRSLGPSIAPTKESGFIRNHYSSTLWQDVDSDAIRSFLDDYDTHADANLVRKELIQGALANLSSRDTVTRWNVAFMSNKPYANKHHDEIAGIPYTPRLRSPDKEYREADKPFKYTDPEGRYVIKRIATEDDELVDVNDVLREKAFELQSSAQREEIRQELRRAGTPEWRFLRQARAAIGYNGLMLVYPIVPDDKSLYPEWIPGDTPYFGFAMIFPGFRHSSTRLITQQAFDEKYGAAA